jgi:hypothetical protein
MLKQIAIFLATLSVLIGSFVLIERTSSPSFQKCISEEGRDESKQFPKEGYSSIRSVIFIHVRCSGRFMDGHGVGLTAFASFIIAAFTATLWSATKQQGLLTFKSLKLAREEFISTHRPKIVVYGMDVKLAGDDKPRHIHFRYINAGDTDASVTFIESRILWTAKAMVAAGIELHRHDTIKEPIPVPSGMNGFAITPDGVDFATLVRSGRSGHDTAFCIGVVVYRDKNDVERRTGFCRRYDSERERWLKVEDEDYEYAY